MRSQTRSPDLDTLRSQTLWVECQDSLYRDVIRGGHVALPYIVTYGCSNNHSLKPGPVRLCYSWVPLRRWHPYHTTYSHHLCIW